MSSIKVTMLVGEQTGASAIFTDPTLSFGRSPENVVVIANEAASRHHGDLRREEDGTWLVVNHSTNLTKVNGKKVKTTRKLKSGDKIGIGNEQFFMVELVQSAPTASAAATPPPVETPAHETIPSNQNVARTETNAPPPSIMEQAIQATNPNAASTSMPPASPPTSDSPEITQNANSLNQGVAIDQDAIAVAQAAKRKKIWLGVGVWIACMLVVFIILASATGGNDDDPNNIPMLSQEDIRDEIIAPLNPQNVAPDPRKHAEYIQEARNHARELQSRESAHFNTLQAYKMARFHAKSDTFDDVKDDRLMDRVKDELIDRVWNTYENAVLLFRSGQTEDALAEFERIQTRLYPDGSSAISRSCEDYIKAVGN